MAHTVDIAAFSGLTDLVKTEIRRRIMSGELPPGQPLRQRELAELLGVSREPIKHAVAALSLEGLIINPPRRSAMVAPITRKNVRDVYEVRVGLDAIVTRAAARLDTAAREALVGKLEELVEAHRALESLQELIELDRLFHLEIYTAADNEVALAAYRSAWTTIGRAIGLLVTTKYYSNSWEEHSGLINAIRLGEVTMAGALAEEHCQRAADWLLEDHKHLFRDLA